VFGEIPPSRFPQKKSFITLINQEDIKDGLTGCYVNSPNEESANEES